MLSSKLRNRVYPGVSELRERNGASLYCAPRPWLGVNFFCFSQSAAAGLFNGRKVCSLPFFYPKWSIWGISAQTFRHGTGLTDSGAFVA
jgi:hypothetical protein